MKITVEKKSVADVGFDPNPVWALCCETWLKEEVAEEKKMGEKMFGSWVTPLVGRHVVKHG